MSEANEADFFAESDDDTYITVISFLKYNQALRDEGNMKKLCITTIGILGTCLLSTYANSASFDCNKAATWVEKTVCESSELSKLDDTMAKKYKSNLDAAPDYEDSKAFKD
ncbi:lysozyme inhibitor LprI family protein, partial [Psychrobacter sp. 1Y4]|uniref:lysozyme inhibitor LprI family protein n=1 Tax=Psychrobacter sp. 1Y4 TaxID=3453575 RepID=UPI003F44A01C